MPCLATMNKKQMRLLQLLTLASSLFAPAALAGYPPLRGCPATNSQGTAAHQMLQTLDSMALLLDSVTSRQKADAAAPLLAEHYAAYISQRTSAERSPEISDDALEQHMARMEGAMNHFRLSCARLVSEKFYHSAALGRIVQTIAQDF